MSCNEGVAVSTDRANSDVRSTLEVKPLEYLGMDQPCDAPTCARTSYAAIVETTVVTAQGPSVRTTALRFCPGCPEPFNVSRLTADERRAVTRKIAKPGLPLRKLRHHLVWRQCRKNESMR